MSSTTPTSERSRMAAYSKCDTASEVSGPEVVGEDRPSRTTATLLPRLQATDRTIRSSTTEMSPCFLSTRTRTETTGTLCSTDFTDASLATELRSKYGNAEDSTENSKTSECAAKRRVFSFGIVVRTRQTLPARFPQRDSWSRVRIASTSADCLNERRPS